PETEPPAPAARLRLERREHGAVCHSPRRSRRSRGALPRGTGAPSAAENGLGGVGATRWGRTTPAPIAIRSEPPGGSRNSLEPPRPLRRGSAAGGIRARRSG